MGEKINFETFFGKTIIELESEVKQLTHRVRIDGAEYVEETRPILKIEVQGVNLLEKLNLPHLVFLLVVSKNNVGNSYTFDKSLNEYICLISPKDDEDKLCFINSVFHEIGHAVLHSYNDDKSLKKELEAWIFSIQKSQMLLGKIKNTDYKILEKHIVDCLSSYKNFI